MLLLVVVVVVVVSTFIFDRLCRCVCNFSEKFVRKEGTTVTTVQWLEVYSFTRSEGGKSYIQRKREREEKHTDPNNSSI